MARLSMAQRRAMPKSEFAVPSKAPGPGSYPIPDAAHKRAAAGLAGMHHASAGVKKAIKTTMPMNQRPGNRSTASTRFAAPKTIMPGQAAGHPHRNLGKYLHPKKG